jgi:hypothetical protein
VNEVARILLKLVAGDALSPRLQFGGAHAPRSTAAMPGAGGGRRRETPPRGGWPVDEGRCIGLEPLRSFRGRRTATPRDRSPRLGLST